MRSIFKRKKNNIPNKDIKFSVRKITNLDNNKFDEVEITIDYDAAALVNSDANEINITTSSSSPSVSGELSPTTFRENLLKKDAPSKVRTLTSIDPKSQISHKDLGNLQNKKISDIKITTEVSFATTAPKSLPETSQEERYNRLYSGQPISNGKQAPSVVDRKELTRGINSRGNLSGKNRPNIIETSQETKSKRTTEVIRASLPPNETVNICVGNTRQIKGPNIPQDPLDASNLGSLNDPVNDLSEDISQMENVIEASIESRLQTHILSVSRLSQMVSGFRVFKREISSVPIYDTYKFMGEYSYNNGISNIMKPIFYKIANTLPCIYRIKPMSFGTTFSCIKDIPVPGKEDHKPTGNVICIQTRKAIRFYLFDIPSIAKKIRIVEKSLLDFRKKTLYYDMINIYPNNNESISPSKIINISYEKPMNDIKEFNIYYENKFGIESLISGFTKKIHGTQPISVSISGVKVSTVTEESSITHVIEASFKFPNPYFPHPDDSFDKLTEYMSEGALNRKNITQVKVTRYNNLGHHDDFGVYTLNQNQAGNSPLVDVDCNYKRGITKMELKVDNDLCELKGVPPSKPGIIYYYVIRPLFYQISNEFSFRTIPEKVTKPGENGKADYSYHPYSFDNPIVSETGINPSADFTSRLDLERYALSNVAEIATVFYSNSNIEHPNITGTYIESTKSYIRVTMNIPPSINSLVDHWILYTAASSNGEWSILQKLDVKNKTTRYLDYKGPELATDSIYYVLEGIGYDMSSISKSVVIEVKLPPSARMIGEHSK